MLFFKAAIAGRSFGIGEDFLASIDQTQDPKAIAELQGRIAAEQAMIQNEQTKLQMYQMVATAEDRVQQQRQKEVNAKIVDTSPWFIRRLLS